MNYIPGFSNYLETSLPRYAVGGRVMDGERMMYDEPMMYDGYDVIGNEMVAPAVQPTTQEVVPFDPNTFDFSGLDLSGLDSLYGMNFGSNFGGGGAGGGIYQADPNIQYIGAPKSNKGNATSQTGGNTFAVRADQPVRLVDHRTNQVVFEGTGFDAARKATELGQGLTNQFGRKANYSIQTADPTGNYSTVAYEKKNKSTLGKIANVAGTALPLATMFIPGLNVLGGIAVGAGLGGAGAALKGDNILKGAVMGGLTSAGGGLLAKPLGAAANLTAGTARALGTGIGATAGGLATGQNLKNSLIGGVLSGGLSYVAPDIQRGLGIGQGANVNTSGGGGSGSFDGINVIGGGTVSPAVTLGGSQNKIQKALGAKEPYDGIDVVGNKFGAVSGVDLGGDQYGAPEDGRSPLDKLTDTANPEAIVVSGNKGVVTPAVSAGGGEITPEYLPKEDIVVDATKIERPVTGGLTLPQDTLADIDKQSAAENEAKKKLGVKDYIDIATLLAGLVSGGGGGGGGGSGGNIPTGMGTLSSLFSKQLPTSTLPSGGALSATALADQGLRQPQDYYRYGYGPQQSFFSYVPQGAPNTSQAYTGYAEGGYAVEGAGDGRDDKIPALLSDGEYVIDAETVALLGNGSNKAGAELLDGFRVNVRKQKGKKLARGEFSDNAKRPEHYMVGGRTQ